MVALIKNLFLDMFNGRSDPASLFRVRDTAASVITPEQAIEAFDQVSRMRNIAYGYTDDGCYARAHLMCRRLLAMDIVPEKAWAFETEDRELVVNFPGGKEQTWWFHVAPTVDVAVAEGNVQKVILDPSLFDGPVGLRQWVDVMQADMSQVSIAPCGKAPESYKGDYTPYHRTSWLTDKKAERTMKEYRSLQDTAKPVVFPSAFRRKWAVDNTSQAPIEGGMPCPNPQA